MSSTLNKFNLIKPNDAVWPGACSDHHTFVDDNFLYVIGRFVGSWDPVEMWKFNLASHKWTKCILPRNFPHNLANFACHSTGNGSFTLYGRKETGGRLDKAVYIGRIVGDNFNMKKIYPLGNKYGCYGNALLFDPARNKTFSVGGTNRRQYTFDVDALQWNETSGSWEWEQYGMRVDDDNGRYGTDAILESDSIYFFVCGIKYFDFKKIVVFNIEQRMYSDIYTKPDPVHGYPRSRYAYSLAQWGRNAIIAGGMVGRDSILSCVWSFNLDTLVWRKMSDLSIPVCYHAASVTAEGQMVVFGGKTRLGHLTATLQTMWFDSQPVNDDQEPLYAMWERMMIQNRRDLNWTAPPQRSFLDSSLSKTITYQESTASLPTTHANETEVNGERSKICSLCNKTKDHVTQCSNVDPMKDSDGTEHIVCVDCIKKRFVFGALKVPEKGNHKSLFCLVKKCSRVIGRDQLLAAVEKPVMVEWMLGSKISLREASLRQTDREKRRMEEEEPQLTPIDSLRFENILDVIDEDAFVHASNLLPDACFSWLLDNFDRGLQYLIEHQATATKRKPKRRDKTGVTHLVETRLKLQTTFQCAICFDDYRTHLAVSCVRVYGGEAAQPHEQHHFCRGCVSGYTVDVEQESIVRGGLGLKCMQPDCAGIFIYSHIEPLLQGRNRNQLQEKIAAAALAAAAVNDIVERCLRCPYGVIIGISLDAQPTFSCANCEFEYCRTCKTQWSESHMGKRCEQVDPKYARRMVENELSLLTVGGLHHCPTCNKPIVKNGGCKKVTCCGFKHLYREPPVITKKQCEAFVQKYIDATDDPLVIAELKKIDCDLFSSPVPRGDAWDVGVQNQMGGNQMG